MFWDTHWLVLRTFAADADIKPFLMNLLTLSFPASLALGSVLIPGQTGFKKCCTTHANTHIF